MIRVSTSFATAAGIVSLALHLSGIAVMWRNDEAQFQGAAPSAAIQLGNSFRSVSEGVQRPIETDDVQETEEVTDLTDPIEQDEPLEQSEPESVLESALSEIEPLPQPTPFETEAQETQSASLAPAPAEEISAEETAAAMTAPVITSDTVDALTVLQTAQTIALEPVQVQPVTAQVPAAQTVPTLDALQSKPVQTQPDVLEPVETTEVNDSESAQPPVLEALPSDESDTAVQVSKRPKLRTREIETAQTQTEKPKPTRRAAPKPQPTQGEQKPREDVGRSDGQVNATAAQSSEANRPATQTGSAAVSNYPGKVVRKIQRARRPRIRGVRGTAHLAFSIAPSGALASLRVSRSSGNAQLDSAALQILRAAAPFPKPPQGARTAFTYRISY